MAKIPENILGCHLLGCCPVPSIVFVVTVCDIIIRFCIKDTNRATDNHLWI